MRRLIFGFLGLVFIASCDQKVIGETQVEESEIEEKTTQNNSRPTGESKMIEIQSIPEEMLIEKRSLRYERIDAGETVQTYAYYNENNTLVKVVEDYRLGKNQNAGLRAYYFEKDRIPVAVVDSYEDWTDTSLVVFSEKRTFYEDGKPVYTDFRTADYYELINEETFQKVKTDGFEIDRVLTILDQKEPFSTYFLGVIETPSFPYLLVGEPNKKDGFQSTLRVSKRSDFIDDLLLNQEKYLNKSMALEYREIEEDNFVFTEFLSGKWKE